jgi:hypothetical protein
MLPSFNVIRWFKVIRWPRDQRPQGGAFSIY